MLYNDIPQSELHSIIIDQIHEEYKNNIIWFTGLGHEEEHNLKIPVYNGKGRYQELLETIILHDKENKQEYLAWLDQLVIKIDILNQIFSNGEEMFDLLQEPARTYLCNEYSEITIDDIFFLITEAINNETVNLNLVGHKYTFNLINDKDVERFISYMGWENGLDL